ILRDARGSAQLIVVAGKPALLGKNFAERLKEARLHKGLNKSQFAKLAGVEYTTIHSWETGQKEPRKHNLETIAHLTGRSVAEFMDDGTAYVEPDLPPALQEFLEGPYGATVTEDELEELTGLRLKNREPTTTTYLRFLEGVRMGVPPGVAKA